MTRHPLAAAAECAADLRRRLRFGGRERTIVVAGGIRRGRPTVKDIDLIVFVPQSVSDAAFAKTLSQISLAGGGPGAAPLRMAIRTAGPRRVTSTVLRGRRRFRVDLFLARSSEKPYALFHHTGSAAYNQRVRAHAKRQGWRLNQYGVYDRRTGAPAAGSAKIRTEEDLARFLGVTPRPPAGRD